MFRAARVFAQLVLVGEIMGIETAVVEDVWAIWSGEVVDVFDDNFQIGKAVLAFIEGKRRVSILELGKPAEPGDDAPFQQEDGEIGHSYKDRDGWFDEEIVYLRVEAMAKLCNGFTRTQAYQWLHKHGVLHKANPKADRWTVYVPRLMPRVTALKIDADRLRHILGEDAVDTE
jgi:hypothetical protein